MYHSRIDLNPALETASIDKLSRARIGATIYLLGVTSLLTDISAEMVASVLPVYLLSVLRLSPFEFGLVDGLYNGSTAVIRILAGYLSDRIRRHKAIAFAGYAFSALSKCGLLLVGLGGWLSIAGVLLIDRIGKGIRTAPRDALIAASAPADHLGTAFGIHRALDTIGAMIGPLLATGILLWLPRRFDYVFTASIVFAIFGLLIIGLYVRPDRRNAKRPATSTGKTIRIADALRSLKTPRFLLLTMASALLSLFTLSDNMIYLGLQKQLGFDSAYMPLLFVATAAVFMSLAVPFGRLADRIGSMKIFLAGYGMLALTYGVFAIFPATGTFSILFYVVLMGAYYAATDGIVAALAVKELPIEAHATGLAFLTSAISVARMGSSMMFGWLWDRTSQQQAVRMFAVAMTVALAFALTLAVRMKFFVQVKR